MRLVELFSTPVVIKELDRKFTVEELIYIDDLLKDTYQNRGNRTSAETFVLRKEPLVDLEQFCLNSVNDYIFNIYKYINCDIKITQSWLNISTSGQFHHLHNHPNSLISGVLYIKTGENDMIQFYRARETTSFLNESELYNQYNSISWYFPVKTGELVIFPSHLYHDVPQVNSDRRISLSFNTFYNNSFGSVEMLTYTG